jgi:hypothetical protein
VPSVFQIKIGFAQPVTVQLRRVCAYLCVTLTERECAYLFVYLFAYVFVYPAPHPAC